MADRWEDMWTRDGGLKPGTQWDANRPLPFIETLFEKGLIPKGRGLVPGCGRAYAVKALARDGRHVTGVDIAPSAVAAAKEFLEGAGTDPKTYSVVEGSFFELEQDAFGFAYDYTFLCALPPAMRQEWAKTYARIIQPGGHLVTVIFPIKRNMPVKPDSPPFELTEDLVTSLLVPVGFSLVFKKSLTSGEAHAGRDGSEGAMGHTTIAVWKRASIAAASAEGADKAAQEQQGEDAREESKMENAGERRATEEEPSEASNEQSGSANNAELED